jgi:hypothetical protein
MQQFRKKTNEDEKAQRKKHDGTKSVEARKKSLNSHHFSPEENSISINYHTSLSGK